MCKFFNEVWQQLDIVCRLEMCFLVNVIVFVLVSTSIVFCSEDIYDFFKSQICPECNKPDNTIVVSSTSNVQLLEYNFVFQCLDENNRLLFSF